jgi:hypothetical protein
MKQCFNKIRINPVNGRKRRPRTCIVGLLTIILPAADVEVNESRYKTLMMMMKI